VIEPWRDGGASCGSFKVAALPMTPSFGPCRRDERRAGMQPRPITDIPLQALLVYEGDEPIVESANPATYLVLEHGSDIAAARSSDRELGRASEGDAAALGRGREVIMFAQLREGAQRARVTADARPPAM
jgi:hypothetical protein